jgi:transcriptional regulator with XRE-family HTH domain
MAREKLHWDALAHRLTVLRAEHRWTAEEVARRADLGSKNTVLRAESGEQHPNNATILKLEQVYGLTEGSLLRLLKDGDGGRSFDDDLLSMYGPEWVRRHPQEAGRILVEHVYHGSDESSSGS